MGEVKNLKEDPGKYISHPFFYIPRTAYRSKKVKGGVVERSYKPPYKNMEIQRQKTTR
jgi:hypothetical protein